MSIFLIACARCTAENHSSSRFCGGCGLSMGAAEADAGAAIDALGPYEAPEPAEPDITRAIRDLVARSGFEAASSGHGWRVVVPLQLDRKQAVYIGYAGIDPTSRPIVTLVSICGTANDRDPRILLKMNARMVEGHFAVKTLRGEEYFVVIENMPVEATSSIDPAGLVLRIAQTADSLEDRLTRGRDLF
ncbi:hypothetical protein P12x_003876 [Tundrisphaera lichenicola]|uniref:hypothetical protein n=1 Tax=Tundrisphaera lichenicola TaxID=2029860 RepID=UPI003EBDB0F0